MVQSLGAGYNHVNSYEIDALPLHPINFTTPQADQERLVTEAKELYREYHQNNDYGKVLALVAQCLPQNPDGAPDMEHEKSDVVHDLHAFLAEEMTRLHKDKRSQVKSFLAWLEKEIIKGSVEDQRNKTKIKNFHESDLESLLNILKRNKVIDDPCPSKVRDAIANEFSAAMNVLAPLKARIKLTDDLIDQIVYKLYGLNEDEIAIVEGRGTS